MTKFGDDTPIFRRAIIPSVKGTWELSKILKQLIQELCRTNFANALRRRRQHYLWLFKMKLSDGKNKFCAWW